MFRLTIREMGLLAVVLVLAIGWGADHMRLSRPQDDDVYLEVLKERARIYPQRDDLQPDMSRLNHPALDLSPQSQRIQLPNGH